MSMFRSSGRKVRPLSLRWPEADIAIADVERR
jgi:hypothetical protein